MDDTNRKLMRVLTETAIPKVAEDWHMIGTSLEVPSEELKHLEMQYSDPKKLLNEAIRYWLRGNGRDPHTMGTLAKAIAIRSPKMGNYLLQHSELCKSHVEL